METRIQTWKPECLTRRRWWATSCEIASSDQRFTGFLYIIAFLAEQSTKQRTPHFSFCIISIRTPEPEPKEEPPAVESKEEAVVVVDEPETGKKSKRSSSGKKGKKKSRDTNM